MACRASSPCISTRAACGSFAQRQWPKCHFVAEAIATDVTLVGGPYDFVLCQEFYPFTRTGALDSHREWLRLVNRNLTTDGLAIIMVSAGTNESINDTYEILRSEFSLRRVRVTNPRIDRKSTRLNSSH